MVNFWDCEACKVGMASGDKKHTYATFDLERPEDGLGRLCEEHEPQYREMVEALLAAIPDDLPAAWTPAACTISLFKRQFNGDYFSVSVQNAEGWAIGTGRTAPDVIADVRRRYAVKGAAA